MIRNEHPQNFLEVGAPANVGTVSYKLADFLSRSVAHLTYNNLCTMKNRYDKEIKILNAYLRVYLI